MVRLTAKDDASDRTKARIKNGDAYEISRECPFIMYNGDHVHARLVYHQCTGWVGWVPESEIIIEEKWRTDE